MDTVDSIQQTSESFEKKYSLKRRIESFKNWPLPYMSVFNLAKAGFLYTGRDDVVVCPWCKLRLYCFEAFDDGFKEHRKYSPYCCFLWKNYPKSTRICPHFKETDKCGHFYKNESLFCTCCKAGLCEYSQGQHEELDGTKFEETSV